MKKFIFSVLFIASFTGYAFYNQQSSGEAPSVTDTVQAETQTGPSSVTQDITNTADSAGNSTMPTPTPSNTAAAVATTATTPSLQKGQYKNGSFTGTVEDAFYGNLQVQAIISGGKITDVKFLQYSKSTPNSRYVNEQAIPILKSEAIKVQSAKVDGASGASYTSAAFKKSLSAALALAI